MKLIIKTLQGKQLPIEVDENDTIAQVKQKIEDEHKLAADLQKLIAYGKVMDDQAKSLKDYQLKDGDFVVVMVSKAKPVAKAQQEDQKTEAKQEVKPQTQSQQPTTQQQPSQSQNQQQTAQVTPQMEEQANELVMISGKPKEQCIQALRAAFGDPNRAFEYLMAGIPSGLGAGGSSNPGGENDYGDDYGDESQPGGGAGVGNNPFAALANNPNFAMIRQRILQDPSFYQQFMQQLQQTQPQIFQLIQQNPAAFMNLILGGDAASGVGGGAAGGGAMGGNPAGGIRVTQEEMDAINRLASLGFPKHKAAEAYLACDKNEELAANYLFENGFEDEDLQQTIAASQQQQQQPEQQQPGGQQQPAEQKPEGQQQPDQEMKDEQQNSDSNQNKPDNSDKKDDNEDQDGGSSFM